MTNRDEISKDVDDLLAGWFDGERYAVDKSDIVEMVLKHSAVTAEPFGWIKAGAATNDEKYDYGMFAYRQQEDTPVPLYAGNPPASVAVNASEPAGAPLELPYRNWRGEISTRKIQPIRLDFGATEWHPEPQWLLVATDIEKNAERSFALKDFNPQQPAPSVAVKAHNHEVVEFLYKHGDLTYGAASKAVHLLADNGFGFTKKSGSATLSAQVQDVAGWERLDDAFSNFINGYGDPYEPKEAHEAETAKNLKELYEAFRAYRAAAPAKNDRILHKHTNIRSGE